MWINILSYCFGNNMELEDKIQEAFAKATTAARDVINADPNNWYPCGFASVKIKPARGKIVKYIKDQQLGYTSLNGGFVVNNPSLIITQRLDAKLAGANAFAKALRELGVDCTVETRLD